MFIVLIGVVFCLAVLLFLLFWQKNKLHIENEVLKGRLNDLEHNKQVFQALSQEALKQNNQLFLDLAKTSFEKYNSQSKSDFSQFIQPIQKSIEKFDQKVDTLEKQRIGAFESIKQQMQSMMEVEKHLRKETSQLKNALSTPHVRGRWGELQLKKVVELAGMVEHCDFSTQMTTNLDGSSYRPDLVVHLPGQKTIIVDSKAPLESYLKALEVEDEEKKEHLIELHAKHVKARITELSKKSYFEKFDPTPEFVVLFLPGEMFFSAALQKDPMLIEYGVESHVMIATPTTLISLLRATAYGWKQESISEHAKYIVDLGKELHKRLLDLNGHWSRLGKNLAHTVKAFNQATGTLETRIFSTAKKFESLDTTSKKKLELTEQIDEIPRELTKELTLRSDSNS